MNGIKIDKNQVKYSLTILFLITILYSNSLNTCKAESTNIYISPGNIQVIEIDQLIKLEIYVENVQDLWSWRADIIWDETLFSLVNTSEGDFLSNVGISLFQYSLNEEGNKLSLSSFMVPRQGPDGNGLLATVYLKTQNATMDTNIFLSDTILLAESNEAGLHPAINHLSSGAIISSLYPITKIYLYPDSVELDKIYDTFKVELRIENAVNMNNWYCSLSWDPNILDLVSHTEGDMLSQYGDTIYFSTPINNEDGLLEELIASSLHYENVNGSGLLASFIFKVKGEVKNSEIRIEEPVYLLDRNNLISPLPLTILPARVTLENTKSLSAYTGSFPIISEDKEIHLNGNLSIGNIEEYIWAINGNEIFGMEIPYTFSLPGEYNVSLTVSNGESKAIDYMIITVADTTPPRALYEITGLNKNNETTVRKPIIFDGTASYDPENGEIVEYKWIFSTNLEDMSMDTYSVFSYTTPGEYQVRYSVLDAYGNSDIKFINITVRDQKPILKYFGAVIALAIPIGYILIKREE